MKANRRTGTSKIQMYDRDSFEFLDF
jgi:hypothetical protein